MKKILLSLLSVALLPLWGCHQPEELTLAVADRGVNNLTVYPTWDGYHTADESGFPSKIDYDNHTITVQVPYTWPVESDNVQKLEDYTNVYVLFNLDNNVFVEPRLHTIDLTKTYRLTVTDQQKQRSEWTLKAELAKSTACDIESFTIRDLNVSALVDKSNATASLIYFEELKNVFADYTLSPHARIVPDPSKEAFWCSTDEPKTFTVIAQDGVTSRKWTLQQREPAKTEKGIRPGSAKLLWARKLSQIGVTELNKTTGIAALDNSLVVYTKDANPIVLDAKNGNPVTTFNLSQSDIAYITADDAGHIILNTKFSGGGTIRLYRMRDIHSTPELFIEFTTTSGAYGNHISVTGDVYGDAVIAASYCQWAPSPGSFSTWRWTIRNGQAVDQKPTWCNVKGLTKGWSDGDFVYTEPDAASDYFLSGYSMNQLVWFDGATNTAKAYIDCPITGGGTDEILAVDAVKFNGMQYVTCAAETPYSYGIGGGMWIFAAEYPETFNGTIRVAYDNSNPQPDALIYDLDRGDTGHGKYGGRWNDGLNDDGSSTPKLDVALHLSPDGYFMYAYFMFCNGYVGCVQFDCIAQ